MLMQPDPVSRLLEAVRHGVLTVAFKTQPCDGYGSKGCSKVDRATCWRYHTDEERLPRLEPKQHVCSFIKVIPASSCMSYLPCC